MDVTQDQEKRPLNELPQVYDSSLKEWIFHQAPAILPLLLPGASYEQTLTVEQIRPTGLFSVPDSPERGRKRSHFLL